MELQNIINDILVRKYLVVYFFDSNSKTLKKKVTT